MDSRKLFYTIFDTKNHLLIVSLLMAFGILLRILGISTFPAGLNQDEASIGYESYSLLTTGFDRNGISFPIHLISWGSGQNALYAYLTMPFIHFFGLNVFTVRIVNVLFSCLSLIVFYSLIKLLFDKNKALVGLALLVICPWSIMAARWGLESNLFPTMFLTGVFFLIKGLLSSQKHFLVSFLIFGISLYAYGTSYLMVPLFLSLTLPFLIYKKKISLKYSVLSIFTFIIVALPILLFIIINHFDFAPIQFLGFTIPRLMSNRTSLIFNLFTTDFFSAFTQNIIRLFNIIITQTDSNEYNSISTFGTIYHISLPFLLIGTYNMVKNKVFITDVKYYILFSWLLSSLILGIFSNVNINRLNIIFFPLLILTMLGLYDVINMLNPEFRKNFKILLVGLYSTLFVFFIAHYALIFNNKIKSQFAFGLGDAIQYAEKIDATSTIRLTTHTINMPYIYVCFYNQINPIDFRETVIYEQNMDGFRIVEGFGRYIFSNNNVKKNEISIISKDEMTWKKIEPNRLKKFGNYYVVYNNKKE